jgi:hypothetical protein
MNIALAANGDSGSAGGALIIILLLIAVYFLPSLIAFARKHHNVGAGQPRDRQLWIDWLSRRAPEHRSKVGKPCATRYAVFARDRTFKELTPREDR